MAKKKQRQSSLDDSRFKKIFNDVPAKAASVIHFLIRISPMIILVGGTAYGSLFLWRDSSIALRFSIPADTAMLPIENAPPGAQKELTRLGQLARGRNILDISLPEDLRRAYENSPWIGNTYPFQRDLQHTCVVADFVLRIPAAQVRSQGYYWQVDRDGNLLPSLGRREPDAKLTTIICDIEKHPEPGNNFASNELSDALAVLQIINKLKDDVATQISQVVVDRGGFFDRTLNRRHTRPWIRLITTNGAVIRWGTNNDKSNRSGEELGNAEKLKLLRTALAGGLTLEQGDTLDVRTRSMSFLEGSAMN